jgi:alpha-galactosidase
MKLFRPVLAQMKLRSAYRSLLPLALAIPLSLTAEMSAQTSTLAATPPMGWNSWNHFAGRVTDQDVRNAADALVSTGMRDAGYIYVNIDDTWQGERDAQGNIQSNAKFPDMKALADYVHSKGLKIGIYSSPGPLTCGRYAGSYGHEQQDAATYAKWGFDYLKYDMCSFGPIVRQESNGDPQKAQQIIQAAYDKMHRALVATGRPIVFSLCQYGVDKPWEWAPALGGNLWRTTGDINATYDRMTLIGFSQAGLSKYAGPGHWNDPDMLEVGNGRLTPDENITHMSLWVLLAAPLLAGNDLSQMTPATLAILTNKEAIAIDQDPLGVQGDRVSEVGPVEIWSKRLQNGDVAVGLFNRNGNELPITLPLSEVGFPNGAKARDIWQAKDLGTLQGNYTVEVPSHGAVLLRLSH